MIRQVELVDRVRAYHPEVDEALLNRAYVFSNRAHGSQKRANGDPYFVHPLEVAGILTDLRLDDATIATALLHDTIEDTDTTYDDIRDAFGDDIASLVDGVTKLSQLELQSESSKQAENFRKFMLATSDDIRVLLVKLADRLHNMRTLHFIQKPDKRRRIAQETLDIYAPLAGRIGMQTVRDELEDLSFAELNPDARESIVARIEFLRASGSDLIDAIKDNLRDTLADAGIEAEIAGRQKRPFSIWRKMQDKHISFEQLSDIFGFRIIVEDVQICYQALGAIHTRWPMVPNRFKDYLSLPKRNGYRSIHTTVVGPERQRVEIQIRTRAMDSIAERGIAAHWSYRDHTAITRDHSAYKALRDLVDHLKDDLSPEEFLEHTKLEMFHDQVFCFTPKGALIALPKGATALDFAYAVHTDIGNRTVGAKINGQQTALQTELNNGDHVSILVSDAQRPSPHWSGMGSTGRARAAIRRAVRQVARAEYIRIGRGIAERAFAEEGLNFSDKAIESALARFRHASVDGVLEAVGNGQITRRELLRTVYPQADALPRRPIDDAVVPVNTALAIDGVGSGAAVHMGGCCHPIRGDRIVGVVMPEHGIVVHTIDCAVLQTHIDTNEEWMDLAWRGAGDGAQRFIGRLRLEVRHEPGALAAVTTAIARNDGNIHDFGVWRRGPDFYLMWIDVEVADLKHMEAIKAALRAEHCIARAERDRGELAENAPLGVALAAETAPGPTQAVNGGGDGPPVATHGPAAPKQPVDA